MKILLVRDKFHFYPADQADRRIYGTVKDGELCIAEIKKNRNLKHHRKFFALLHKLLENSDEWKTLEEVLTVVLFSIGYAEKVKLFNGREVLTRKSIAFENMDQTEFSELYTSAVKVIAEYLGCTPEELEGEV